MKAGVRIGYAFCGSFCTFERSIASMQTLLEAGAELVPIFSEHALQIDTRFGTAESFRSRIEALCGTKAICAIPEAEPIGVKGLFDLLCVAPCTGNTLSKLAAGITDTTVTMAVKSQLRRGRPVLLALSTNDGLSGSAPAIAALMNRKHYYFVPFGQDDSLGKPSSLVAEFRLLRAAAEAALERKQLQPILQQASCETGQ